MLCVYSDRERARVSSPPLLLLLIFVCSKLYFGRDVLLQRAFGGNSGSIIQTVTTIKVDATAATAKVYYYYSVCLTDCCNDNVEAIRCLPSPPSFSP